MPAETEVSSGCITGPPYVIYPPVKTHPVYVWVPVLDMRAHIKHIAAVLTDCDSQGCSNNGTHTFVHVLHVVAADV